jgi:hypothetical protein
VILERLLHLVGSRDQLRGARLLAGAGGGVGGAAEPHDGVAVLAARPERGRGRQTPDDVFVISRARLRERHRQLDHPDPHYHTPLALRYAIQRRRYGCGLARGAGDQYRA